MEPLLSIRLILQTRIDALNPCFEGVDEKVLAYSLLPIKKSGSGGTIANLILATSNGHGVVLCKLLKTRLTGNPFAKFFRKSFAEAFSKG